MHFHYQCDYWDAWILIFHFFVISFNMIAIIRVSGKSYRCVNEKASMHAQLTATKNKLLQFTSIVCCRFSIWISENRCLQSCTPHFKCKTIFKTFHIKMISYLLCKANAKGRKKYIKNLKHVSTLLLGKQHSMLCQT